MKKIILQSSNQVISEISQLICQLAQQCISKDGRFTVALSGGSTPELLYQHIISNDIFKALDSGKIHFYFSDERYVNLDDDRSNYKLAKVQMLSHLGINYDNVYPVNTSYTDCNIAASEYQKLICGNIKKNNNNIPEFDLIILGIGTDGHTASLFPGSDLIVEKISLVASCFHAETKTNRITFTFPLINAASHVYIMALGKGKRQIMESITMCEQNNDIRYPVQHVKPQGELIWFHDKDANMSNIAND